MGQSQLNRVERVKRRVRVRQKRQSNRRLVGVSMLGVVASMGLMFTFQALLIPQQRAPSTELVLSGSMLLHDGMESYVFVAVLAFLAGIVVTYICVMWQKRNRQE